MNRVCFHRKGLEYSVVKRHWTKAEIRLYTTAGWIVLWTAIDATLE